MTFAGRKPVVRTAAWLRRSGPVPCKWPAGALNCSRSKPLDDHEQCSDHNYGFAAFRDANSCLCGGRAARQFSDPSRLTGVASNASLTLNGTNGERRLNAQIITYRTAQHLRGFRRGTENRTSHAFRFGSVSRSRSRRFVISPWIGIFARLKPQCANACGYLLPDRYCPRFRNQNGPGALLTPEPPTESEVADFLPVGV
jgi:hypothetical protein